MKTYLPSKFLIKRDSEKCIQCKVCVNQCSFENHYYDPEDDEVRSSEQNLKTPILFLDKLAQATKFEKAKIIKEMELRQAVLAYMLRHQVRAQEDVAAFIKRFYLDLEGLIRDTPDLFGKPPQPAQEAGKVKGK